MQEKEAEKNQNNADTDELNKSIRDLNDQLLGKKDELKNELDKEFKKKIEDDFKKQLETYFNTISNSINTGSKLNEFITDLKKFIEILDRCEEYSGKDYTIKKILDDAVKCFGNLQKLAGYTKEDLLIDQITGVGNDNLFRLEKFDMVDDNIKKTLLAIVKLYNDYLNNFQPSDDKPDIIPGIIKNFTDFKDDFELLDTIYNLTENLGQVTIPNMTEGVSINIPVKFSADFTKYKQRAPKEEVSVYFTPTSEQALRAAGKWQDKNLKTSDCSRFADQGDTTILDGIKYQQIIENLRNIARKFLNDNGSLKYGGLKNLVFSDLYDIYKYDETNADIDEVDIDEEQYNKKIEELSDLSVSDLSAEINKYTHLSAIIKGRILNHQNIFENLWTNFESWQKNLVKIRSKTIFGKIFNGNPLTRSRPKPSEVNESTVSKAFLNNSFKDSSDIINFMTENFYKHYITDRLTTSNILRDFKTYRDFIIRYIYTDKTKN